MKRLIAFILLLVGIGGGAYYYFVARKPEEKPQVLFATISQGEIIESVQATGSLDPVRRVDVGSQVSGQVQAIYVDYNQVVHEGQLLAKIDPTLLETQVKIQESNVARQEGDIASQEVQLQDLERQLARTRELFEKGLQNQQQLEQAELSVKTRQAQIDAARKQLVQTKINLDQARLNVSYTDIKSPIDGVVVERKVDRGATVQASMTSPQFFVLATDLRTLKLTAGVDEAEIGRVRPGQEVIFTVEAYPNQEFYGKVNSVRLNATNQSNVITYPVWIDVMNPDLKLRPSMTANARIVISRAQDVVRVPNQALRFRPNSEQYLALGLTPPTPGQGRAGGRANNAQNQQGGQAGGRQGQAGGGTGRGDESAQTAGRQGGAAGDAGGRSGGQGFGAQASGNLDPEAMARVRQQFGGRGGGGGGRSGRRGQQQTNLNAPLTPLNADKIDDLYAVLQKQIRPGQIWTWNPESKELKSINVRLGIDDGTFSELVSGDITPGMQVVTGIILPASRTSTGNSNNNLFNPNQRGGPGGFDRGGFGGGGRGGGGGGGRGR